MMNSLIESLSIMPIIAAIKELDKLDLALDSPCENIFLLSGNIFNLKELSQRVKSKNKGFYILVDSIDGFSKDTWGLEYIVKNIELDGIITKKTNLVKQCKDMGIFTIQRMPIHNSEELVKSLNSIRILRPNMINICPGIISKIIDRIYVETKIPIIASGLIENKKDIELALSSGAYGISSTKINTWYMY